MVNISYVRRRKQTSLFVFWIHIYLTDDFAAKQIISSDIFHCFFPLFSVVAVPHTKSDENVKNEMIMKCMKRNVVHHIIAWTHFHFHLKHIIRLKATFVMMILYDCMASVCVCNVCNSSDWERIEKKKKIARAINDEKLVDFFFCI